MNSIREMAFAYIDAHRDEMAEYLGELIRIKSVNQGNPDTCDERDVANFIRDRFASLGLETSIVYGDDACIRPNVFGILKGAGGGKSLMFNAHMDTVPAPEPEQWKYQPFSGTVADGRVYGRGANDDKNGIAVMTYAAEAVIRSGAKLKGDVILLASAGEESQEGGVYGAGKAIEKSGIKADFAVVGEESGMSLLTEGVSLLFFEVVIPGKAAHISVRNQMIFPQSSNIVSGSEAGVDALEKALPIIDMLYRKERDWNLNTMRSETLGSGGTPQRDSSGVGVFTITPVAVHGDTYFGSTIGELRLTYGVWYNNLCTVEDIRRELARDIAAVASTDSWLKEHPPVLNMPIIQDWPGFHTDVDHPGVQMIKRASAAVMGKEPIVTGARYVCDATYINEQGIPSVVMGAGNGDNGCHGQNEFTAVEDLVNTAKIYVSAILDWCE